MSKLPRPSTSKLARPSIANRQSVSRPSTSRPSTSRPSVSRPSVSRPSISRPSVARPSTIGGKTQIDVKSNVSSNIKVILEYLIENEYPSVLTKKNLMNPTEATFRAILKFIIRDFYPDFECKSLASDVIYLLNSLDYPYPLKESHFTPIGSPHSWPHLLEALSFICNLSRMMAYEKENVSQLYTLNAKDEEEADEELNHIVMMAKCYREYQTESGHPDDYVEKYLKKLDTEGKINQLERTNQRLVAQIEVLKESNAKFPEAEAEYQNKFNRVRVENDEIEHDKNHFMECIAAKKQEGEDAQKDIDEKAEQLVELSEEADRHKKEIVRLQAIIAEQPPQHEVQAKKQLLADLLDKTNNLKEETRVLNDEISIKQVAISNQQRELKEKMRKMLEEIKVLIQDEVKFDLDKAIDNKSIMQAAAIMDKLKKKIAADKEESRKISDQLYDLEIMKQSLEDDLRLSQNSLFQAKDMLLQKEAEFTNERKKLIAESDKLTEKVKDTRATIEELRKQLGESESEDIVCSRIIEGKKTFAQIKEEIKLYQSIRKHRTNELLFLYQETNNEFKLVAMLLSMLKTRNS